MLSKWTELLPLFIVRWLALRMCEQIQVSNSIMVTARPDVLVRVPDNKI